MKKQLSCMLLVLASTSAQGESLRVDCVSGCLPRGDDVTVDLLLRADGSGPVTLRWQSTDNPAPGKETFRLYAGNPAMQDTIPDRGELKFAPEGGVWQATYQVPAEDLGKGTFLAVVVRKKGGDEEILDWRPFRLMTTAERERMQKDPEPAGAWSLDVRPSVLQATTGHGELPRSRGGDERVWWPISLLAEDTSDLDLDGESTGIPGLGVQVSIPWPAGAGQTDWKQAVLDKLTGVEGHTVHFGDLQWVEKPERVVPGGLRLGHFYTVVTLYTNPSIRSFDAKEVGGGGLFTDPTYFAHETSARLKHPDDVRFWASYSRREYGADGHLLDLLRRQSEDNASVPGLGGVQSDDGDGGSMLYRVGFVARVRPWEPGRDVEAGFAGVDVVAARAGYGGVRTQGSAGQAELERVWCQVVRCDQGGHDLDLDKPPAGYDVAQPAAALSTLPSGLATSEFKPPLAPRDVVVVLPRLTRFVLAANLRAGALIRKGSFGNARNLVPINSYAQYVLKFTVAMGPKTVLVTSDEAVMPKPPDLGFVAPVPKPTGLLAWIREHVMAVGFTVVLIALVVLVLAVPGLGAFVGSILRLFRGKD